MNGGSRGGRIRTGEPPRPKRGALTRLSYTPLSPAHCTDRVAVCADEFALGDLLEHPFLAEPADQIADVVGLLAPWQVVPLHRRSGEPPAAVAARTVLQCVVPDDELLLALGAPLPPPGESPGVVGSVVDLPALLAPRLEPVAAPPPVELAHRLHLCASPAALLHDAILPVREDVFVSPETIHLQVRRVSTTIKDARCGADGGAEVTPPRQGQTVREDGTQSHGAL